MLIFCVCCVLCSTLFFCFVFFYLYAFCVFFFFFQAEDGIRDLTVTGVQTCALPICGFDSRHPLSPLVGARLRRSDGKILESSFALFCVDNASPCDFPRPGRGLSRADRKSVV